MRYAAAAILIFAMVRATYLLYPKDKKSNEAAPHHTSDFYIDESGFIVGVKAFCQLVFDYAKVK